MPSSFLNKSHTVCRYAICLAPFLRANSRAVDLVQKDAAVQLGDGARVIAHDAADVLDDAIGL